MVSLLLLEGLLLVVCLVGDLVLLHCQTGLVKALCDRCPAMINILILQEWQLQCDTCKYWVPILAIDNIPGIPADLCEGSWLLGRVLSSLPADWHSNFLSECDRLCKKGVLSRQSNFWVTDLFKNLILWKSIGTLNILTRTVSIWIRMPKMNDTSKERAWLALSNGN